MWLIGTPIRHCELRGYLRQDKVPISVLQAYLQPVLSVSLNRLALDPETYKHPRMRHREGDGSQLIE